MSCDDRAGEVAGRARHREGRALLQGRLAVACSGCSPRGIPPELVNRIRDDIAAVLKIPSVREQLIDIGGEPSGMAPTEFGRYVRAEIDIWNKVAEVIGFPPN